MRTTYKSPNIQQSAQSINVSVTQNENIDSIEDKEQLKKQYQFLYLQTVEEAELKTSLENSFNNINNNLQPINYEINMNNRINTPYVQPNVKKKKSNLIPILVVFLIIAAIIGGLLFYFLVIKKNQREEEFNSVQEKVNSFYTDDRKVDTVEGLTVDDVLEVYQSIDSSDETYSDLLLELTTIETYLNAKSMLIVYESPDYDLESEGLKDKLVYLKECTTTYTVEGLSSTVSKRVDYLLSEYDLYISLKTEMLGVTDYINYDAGYYDSQIMTIQHTKNKEYLLSIHEDLKAKQIDALVEQNTPEPEVVATPTDATPMDATPIDAVPIDTEVVE